MGRSFYKTFVGVLRLNAIFNVLSESINGQCRGQARKFWCIYLPAKFR